MYKNSINSNRYPAYDTWAARRKRQHSRNWKEIIGGAALCLIVAAILNVVFINAVLFPNCNRTTNDCFLIQKLWGAK